MKLSEMIKDEHPGVALSEQQLRSLTDPTATIADDDDEEDEFGAQLSIAIDLMRQASSYLGYFNEVNTQTGFMGDKGSETLRNFVEEINDFLGDYSDT